MVMWFWPKSHKKQQSLGVSVLDNWFMAHVDMCHLCSMLTWEFSPTLRWFGQSGLQITINRTSSTAKRSEDDEFPTFSIKQSLHIICLAIAWFRLRPYDSYVPVRMQCNPMQFVSHNHLNCSNCTYLFDTALQSIIDAIFDAMLQFVAAAVIILPTLLSLLIQCYY